MENISTHITYAEAIHSDTAKRLGISNIPTEEHLARMRTLAAKVFEPLRQHFDVPIYVSSFFRTAALNKALKGAKNSQHMLGEAMDIDAEKYGGITNKAIFEFIRDNLEYDQLLWEFGTDVEPDWVHVSYTTTRPNRKQVLTIKK
jgi:phosphoribosylaminoimidazole-succinocarboxamide synthase